MPNVYVEEEKRHLAAQEGESLMSVLLGSGLPLSTPCGGKGRCKKCEAEIIEKNGVKRTVLACRYPVKEDLTVTYYRKEALDAPVFEAGSLPEEAGIAVDLGTTTLVLGLTDLRTGSVVSSLKVKNPLSVYGADVLSRLTYSKNHPEARENIKRLLAGALIRGIKDLLTPLSGKLSDIKSVSVAANSAMRTLFLGDDPEPLIKPPFTPERKEALSLPSRQAGLLLPSNPPVFLLPLIENFAGADTAAGILYAKDQGLSSYLLVDIGTNTEIVASQEENLMVCTAPSGPAFEGMDITCGSQAVKGAISGVGEDGSLTVIGGGEPESICGSGLVSVCAHLLRLGALSKDGKITGYRSPYEVVEVDGVRAFKLAPDVLLTQKDIRALQLAKGAIQAGIRRVCKEGVPKTLILTGAFGRGLNLSDAQALGLLPGGFDAIRLVENASLEGSARYLSDSREREELDALIQKIRSVNLSEDPAFQEDFIHCLSF